MKKVFALLSAAGLGLFAACTLAVSAWAAPVMIPSGHQLERHLETDPGITKVHRWHCRTRRGHYHPEACGGGYDPYDPYDDPRYDDPYYDDGPPDIVIQPSHRRSRSRRVNRRCTRALRRGCNRRWRDNRRRRLRCLRKYNCR